MSALDYLRSAKDYKLSEDQARAAADRISKGCDGATRRFVKVTGALVRAGLSANDAFQEGFTFAGLDDKKSETFLAVFKRAYARDQLDMDLRSSVLLARSLSSEFNGESEKALRDFDRLLAFCVGTEGLNQSRPVCGLFSARLAKLGEIYKEEMADGFFETYRFLTAQGGGLFKRARGPGVTTGDALRVAEKVAGNGPVGVRNFIDGYTYAASERGLGFDISKAMAFAEGMALRTLRPGSAVAYAGQASTRQEAATEAVPSEVKPPEPATAASHESRVPAGGVKARPRIPTTKSQVKKKR